MSCHNYHYPLKVHLQIIINYALSQLSHLAYYYYYYSASNFYSGKKFCQHQIHYHHHGTKCPTSIIQLQGCPIPAIHSVTKNTDGDISEKMDDISISQHVLIVILNKKTSSLYKSSCQSKQKEVFKICVLFFIFCNIPETKNL